MVASFGGNPPDNRDEANGRGGGPLAIMGRLQMAIEIAAARTVEPADAVGCFALGMNYSAGAGVAGQAGRPRRPHARNDRCTAQRQLAGPQPRPADHCAARCRTPPDHRASRWRHAFTGRWRRGHAGRDLPNAGGRELKAREAPARTVARAVRGSLCVGRVDRHGRSRALGLSGDRHEHRARRRQVQRDHAAAYGYAAQVLRRAPRAVGGNFTSAQLHAGA